MLCEEAAVITAVFSLGSADGSVRRGLKFGFGVFARERSGRLLLLKRLLVLYLTHMRRRPA